MIYDELSLPIDDLNSLELNIPEGPSFTSDEIEIWLVCEGKKRCVFKDSWEATFLPEVVHVVNRFRNHNQHGHYMPTELEWRYFHHLSSGEIDEAIWDYLLFSSNHTHVFLVENKDADAVLVVSEMYPYGENPEFRRIGCYTLDRSTILLLFDKLVKELEMFWTSSMIPTVMPAP